MVDIPVTTPESTSSAKPDTEPTPSDSATTKRLGEVALDELAQSNIAINFDLSRDREELIHDETERWFNEAKNAPGKSRIVSFFRRVGYNFFEKYHKLKHEKAIRSGEIKVKVKEKNEKGEYVEVEKDINEAIKILNDTALCRFVRSLAKGSMEDGEYKPGNEYLHQGSGEELKKDEVTTKSVCNAIEAYAKSIERIKLLERSDLKPEELEREKKAIFEQELKNSLAGNENLDKVLENNRYFIIAENAVKELNKKDSDHELDDDWKEILKGDDEKDKEETLKKISDAMTKVLEGFAVYNAVVHEGSRSEQRKDNIDKIIDALDKRKITRFIKPEIITAASGILSLIGKSFLNKAARLIIPVGGIVVSSAFAGAREHRRVNQDRERMMRDRELGLDYGGTGADASGKPLSRAERKRQKYENKIKETLYETHSATDLTDELNKALENFNSSKDDEKATAEEALSEIYEKVFTYREYSDWQNKGLITYSSVEKRGDERLKLDIILAEAKIKLGDKGEAIKKHAIETAKGNISDENTKDIIADVTKKDWDFHKKRASLVAARVAKTAAFGALAFLGSQEIIATFDPNKISLAEEIGLKLNGPNANGAERTILASGWHAVFGNNPSTQSSDIADVLSNRGSSTSTNSGSNTVTEQPEYANSDPSKGKPYEGSVKWTSSQVNEQGIPDSKITSNYKIVTDMHGDSYLNGQPLNYDDLALEGKIKGMVIINGARYEVEGEYNPITHQMVFGNGDGFIDTVNHERIQLFNPSNGEKLYQYFEVGNKPSTNEWEVFATNGGTGNGSTYNGVFQTLAETNTSPRPDLPPMVRPNVAPRTDLPPMVGESVSTSSMPPITGNGAGETIREAASSSIYAEGIPFTLNARRGLGEARPATPVSPTAESGTPSISDEEIEKRRLESESEMNPYRLVSVIENDGLASYPNKNRILYDDSITDYRTYWDEMGEETKQKLLIMAKPETGESYLLNNLEENKEACKWTGKVGLPNFFDWLLANADALAAESTPAAAPAA